MGINHLTTSPRHPQCKYQAEVVNKTIAKYLSSFVDDTTLDWELYLAPLMFSYNTSIHQSTRNTPFFLTFGMEPRAPHFPQPDQRRHFYGENDTDELYHRLQLARQLAIQQNEEARHIYTHHHDKRVKPLRYHEGQQVLLDEHAFLHKNKKLAPKWSGPHTVIRLVHDTNVELRLANNRKTIVHVNRLKPYLQPGLQQLQDDVNNPDPGDPAQQQQQPVPSLDDKDAAEENINKPDKNDNPTNDDIPQFVEDRFIPFSNDDFNGPANGPANDGNIQIAIPPPPKRGRGRPPKGVISKKGEGMPPPRKPVPTPRTSN